MKKLMIGLLILSLLLTAVACASTSAIGPAPVSTDADGAPERFSDAPAVESGFTDVPVGADYAEAMAWCVENNLMNGIGGNRFDPAGTLDRRTLATVLYRYAGEPAVTVENRFSDVQDGQWYTDAVLWADQQGLLTGYGGGVFGAADPVTRVQMDVIFGRYQGENPVWPGDPARTPATRAEVAVSLMENLNGQTLQERPGQADGGKPAVYMTANLSPEGLMAVYEALNWAPTGSVAVKLSTGEPPASNYLDPNLIKDLVQKVDGAIVECNTAYGGSRASTAMHYQVAEDHGFTAIADVDIMDEEGSMTLPVTGGDNLTENYVGTHFSNYDSFLVLSHFKGHSMAGFGGAIKNISIGIASAEGKSHIHSGGTGGSMWGGEQDAFLESMAEAGKSVVDALDGRIVYINVMNRLSVDCDCDGSPAEPELHDIGILASTDPVALDQACVDLVYSFKDADGASLVRRIESRNGLHALEQAEKIGLGSRAYELVDIDAR